ncbi:MAG TPA: hypothetical protein EYM75_03465 [Dehalococcoidia bacterium]|nr:hypothetical protein [Dehalococcoidia bacterium]
MPRGKPKNLVVNHRRFFNYDKILSAQSDSIYIGNTVKKDFDLLIIGGGSAELTAGWFARQLDLSVAIVEKGRLGGDCTWIGGIPRKTLLRAAKSAHTIRDAARFGVIAPEPAIDFKSVMGRVNSVVQKIFEAELSDALESEGIEVTQDEARFVSPQAVAVDGREISARRFLLCTGAGPVIPPIDGLSEVDYLT